MSLASDYARQQIASMNHATHQVCPECRGTGGQYVQTGQTWASGNPVEKWAQCPRCNGNCIVPKG